ncbi:MAG: hypothetical protein KBD00_00220 [Candidatus Peribacteraceae bacterium]|nr:hypothetical protein [Candidatus Peribacteraceae bacterium]
MQSLTSRIGLTVALLLVTAQTASAYSPYDRWYFSTPATTSYSRDYSATGNNCPLYDYANPPSGYRYQCTKDRNNCTRCTLQYAGPTQTIDNRICSPAACEGDATVRTCSNGTILYPSCSRQTDGRCVRSTPQCPANTTTLYYNNNYYSNVQNIFPQPLSNCSTKAPVQIPGCQYICSDNQIGRCPSCRYYCSSYAQFPVSPVTQPDQTIFFPYNTDRIRSMTQ